MNPKRKGGGKSTPPPKNRKRSAKRKKKGFPIQRVTAAVGLLLVLVITAALSAHYLLKPDQTPEKTAPSPEIEKKAASETSPPIAKKTPEAAIPPFEVYPEEKPSSRKITPPRKIIPTLPIIPSPRMAIIIDDIGYDYHLAMQFIELDVPLTLSILPHSPYGKKIARAAHVRGIEIMLHLPMEPEEYPKIDPGPGALLAEMTPDQLLSQLRQNLDAVPHIKGVNNHMGSHLTSKSDKMYQVFTLLKRNNLYFIDSRTSPHSQCEPAAKMLKVPFAQRDVFLDHHRDSKTIHDQFEYLLKLTLRHGKGVGIGHPIAETLETLRAGLKPINGKVTIVPASHLVSNLSENLN